MEKKKILVIDDEIGFTELVKLNLEATGNYVVKIENDGTKAFQTIQAFLPDLILLDIIMPNIEGPDVVNKMRNSNFKHIPIIFLTATVTKAEVEAQEGKIGGHEFLAKPSTVKELVDCIERHL